MKSRPKRTKAVYLLTVAIVVAACGGSVRQSATGGCTTREAVVHATPQVSARYTEFCTSALGAAMVAGPDDALWFMEGDRPPNNTLDRIGRITAAGALSEFPIPRADGLGAAIASGSDGALWFTGYPARLGRITTRGAVTKYSVEPHPSSIVATLDITPSPDGALWFALQGSYFGRLTTSGVATIYLCNPCLGHSPTSIARGPDGALWFVVYGEISRMTATGAFDQSAKAPHVWAERITLGPDGNLWFTEDSGSSRIGRITASGTVTEFPIPREDELVGGATGPTNITGGHDGALWFTETSHRIGRITTSGVVTEYPISAQPTSAIAAGPDRAIWFAEVGSRIGRLSLP